MINGIDIKKSIANFLWENLFFTNDRYLFSALYPDIKKRKEFIQSIWAKKLLPLLPENNQENIFYAPEITNVIDNLIQLFHSFQNSVVFYCINNRMLNYILPVAEELDKKSIIVSLKELDENLVLSEQIQIIEIDIIRRIHPDSKGYIKDKFPLHFFLSCTFDLLISKLLPKCVVFIEGCHYDSGLLAAVCKKNKVPTVCLQQGWPGLIHTRFTNMGYDYYLTWGKRFTEYWQVYNPCVKFLDIGYFPEIGISNNTKSGITFFFQGPLFTIDHRLINMMAAFAIDCAKLYPERTIYIRQHPEFKLSKVIIAELNEVSNIKFADKIIISQLFSNTLVGVGVFSTTLIEGLAHGTIPFIFNLTSWPNYYPNLNEMKLGVEVKTLEEAKNMMDCLIKNTGMKKEDIQKNILNRKNEFFTVTGTNAIKNTCNLINSLTA